MIARTVGCDDVTDAAGRCERPNVVLIYMDDMTHWTLRSGEVSTPNLDRLREQGTTFLHAVNQGSMSEAVCTPARQMLLSGLSVFHAAERFMDVPRLGRVLTEAGYDSFFTGKWHNETAALEDDYTTVGPWAGSMLRSTEKDGAAYGRPRPGNTWDPADTSLGGHWMRLPGGSVRHSSEHWTDAAISFLEEDHSDRPFFLHLAYHAPHDPRQAPREFLDLYEEDDILVPPNAMPEHPFDNGELGVRDELLAPFPRTEQGLRLHRREYFAILSHADAQVGRVLDVLREIGAEDDTVVVFSGDHGLALGEHGLFGKQNLYEHSIRVPLVFRGPGVREGAVRDDLVYSGSILPTICDLIGIDSPGHVEFASLAPLLGPGADEREVAGETALFGAYKDLQRTVRTTGYKLIEYRDAQNNQLFDLDEDPWELRNRYDDEGLAEVRRELTDRLRALQRALDDPILSA